MSLTLSKKAMAVKPSSTLAITAKAKEMKANGIDVPYVIAPRRNGDIDECYANCDKALKELNYSEINEDNAKEVFEKIAEIQSRKV